MLSECNACQARPMLLSTVYRTLHSIRRILRLDQAALPPASAGVLKGLMQPVPSHARAPLAACWCNARASYSSGLGAELPPLMMMPL